MERKYTVFITAESGKGAQETVHAFEYEARSIHQAEWKAKEEWVINGILVVEDSREELENLETLRVSTDGAFRYEHRIDTLFKKAGIYRALGFESALIDKR